MSINIVKLLINLICGVLYYSNSVRIVRDHFKTTNYISRAIYRIGYVVHQFLSNYLNIRLTLEPLFPYWYNLSSTNEYTSIEPER